VIIALAGLFLACSTSSVGDTGTNPPDGATLDQHEDLPVPDSSNDTPQADHGLVDVHPVDGPAKDLAQADTALSQDVFVGDLPAPDLAQPDVATQDAFTGDLLVPPAGTVGASCTITGAGGQTKMFVPSASDCQTAGCLYYGAGVPLCTKICASDADCPPGTTTCPGGFGCGVPFVTTMLACCKMCICRDYLPGGTPPNPSYCQTVTPNCPP